MSLWVLTENFEKNFVRSKICLPKPFGAFTESHYFSNTTDYLYKKMQSILGSTIVFLLALSIILKLYPVYNTTFNMFPTENCSLIAPSPFHCIIIQWSYIFIYRSNINHLLKVALFRYQRDVHVKHFTDFLTSSYSGWKTLALIPYHKFPETVKYTSTIQRESHKRSF